MNYSKQQPNGPLAVADQIAFCKRNSGTRLIGAPDNDADHEAIRLANYGRWSKRVKQKLAVRSDLLAKGYSVLTVNRNRVKKNHRN